MACLKVISTRGMRVLPESPNGNVYGKLPDEQIVGVVWDCAQLPGDNLTDVFTSEGLMIGNLIKKVTSAVGIKQCLACKGRQRRFNQRGLAIQKKLKDLL